MILNPYSLYIGVFFTVRPYHSLVKRGLKVIPALNLHNPTFIYIPAVVLCMHVVYVCAVIRVCACRLTNTLQLCMVLLLQFLVLIWMQHLIVPSMSSDGILAKVSPCAAAVFCDNRAERQALTQNGRA